MNTPPAKPDLKAQNPASEQKPATQSSTDETRQAASPETEQKRTGTADDTGTKAASPSSTHSQRSEMNTQKKTSSTAKSGSDNQNAIDLLKADHQEVDQLFEKFKNAKGRQRKKLIEQIAVALRVHTIIEEEIFYPACRKQGVEEDNLDEAQVEHDTIKLLLRELLEGNQDDEYYDAKVTVLSEYVKHHVKEEEAPDTGIMARAEKTDIDLAELGQELQERKDELMEDEEQLLDRSPRIRSLHVINQSSRSGSRFSGSRDQGRSYQSGYGECDQSGRFQSEDERSSRRYAGGQGGYAGQGDYSPARYPGASGRGSEWADREDYSDYYNEGGRYPRGYRADPGDRFGGGRYRDH